MSSFAALMALSASQTQESEAAIKSALVERQRKDAAKKKAQEEKEKRERAMEAALRKRHLEEVEREKQKRQREVEERAAKERETERREAEQRDALRYGPKRSKSEYPSVRRGGGGGGGSGGSRPGDSDDEGGGGLALTREEKRRRRLEQELKFGTSRRAGSSTSGYKRAGRRLPGGAVDITVTGESGGVGNYRSIREKLASEPATLIKLNTNKRDTRTIDEIVQDLAKTRENRILEGENAKDFADWFGKKGKLKNDGQSQPQSQSQSQPESRSSSVFGSPVPSGREGSFERGEPAAYTEQPPATTPVAAVKTPIPKVKSASSTPPVQPKPKPPAPAPKAERIPIRGSSISVKAVGGKSATSTPRNGVPPKPPKPTPSFTKVNGSSRPPAGPSKPSLSEPQRKRPRSPSRSVSPPPKRRPVQSARQQGGYGNEIWAMFGKDRNRYMNQDIFSDDEDMEADAMDLEKEELISARVARQEDEVALEEEKRHEEEKRRKRKEKERRGY